MPTPLNATNSDIIAMLRDGHSNLRISRELRCDKTRVARLRIELGLSNVVLQPLTLEQKWATKTRPVEGGHLEWVGERAKTSGTPVMRYKEVGYSPAAVAFRMKHGREPQGYVRAECDFKHCVAPDHVNDEAGRQQARLARRAERGMGALPTVCVSGHDMTEHARLEPDGTAYCGLCKLLDKQAKRDPSIPRPHRQRPTSLEEALRIHAEPVDGGHVRWLGGTSHSTPRVWFNGTTYSAYRIAFRVQHGRDPEGQVRPSCDMPLCVAGAHMEDRPMRQRTNSLYDAIFGAAS
ncbi:hypothetical protein RFN58_07115 [Streptomyces iakyrus]|uniref:hypothetical protein n=1 Tax=Streptomyces iakyrus TaxID=68219 RepID=UPI00068F9CF1|nr:hypothetical protein [Streptomyces iakyrus]